MKDTLRPDALRAARQASQATRGSAASTRFSEILQLADWFSASSRITSVPFNVALSPFTFPFRKSVPPSSVRSSRQVMPLTSAGVLAS